MIILAAMRVHTLCVTFLAGMCVHLVVALPVSSEASGSKSLVSLPTHLLHPSYHYPG